MIETVNRPLIPVGVLPQCDARGCTLSIGDPAVSKDDRGEVTFNAFSQGDGYLEHRTPSGQVARFVLLGTWLADVNMDIWAKIRPWAESLHEDEAAA